LLKILFILSFFAVPLAEPEHNFIRFHDGLALYPL